MGIDLEVAELRDSLIRGGSRAADALPRLRELVRRKIQSESSNRATPVTPALKLEAEDATGDCLETLFALAMWEASGEQEDQSFQQRVSSDLHLLEQCIMETTKTTLQFEVAVAWLALKCRPGALKDELNDAHQLLDRYMGQFAREYPSTKPITRDIQVKYAFIVELLALRVFPALNLFESSQSLLSKENVRPELLSETDRERLDQQLKAITPANRKPGSTQQQAEAANGVAVPTAQGNAPPIPMGTTQPLATAGTSSVPNAQQLIEEFERRRRQAHEEEQMLMVKTAIFSASAALVVGILFSERKRIAKFIGGLGDALFGE